MDALRRQFRPEFVNRVDEILVFRPLDRSQISQIVEIQLRDLRRRLAERKLSLRLSDEARQYWPTRATTRRLAPGR